MSDSRAGGQLPIAVGIVGRHKAISALGQSSSLRPGISRGQLRGRQAVWREGLPTRPPAPGAQSASFDQMIRSAARQEGVDEQLVKAVVEAESGFNPQAVSHAGAKGLMQLMDGTARSLGVRDPFDPASNVTGGTKFLRSLLDRFGSVPLALAAYNAGPGAVEKYGGVPPYQETRKYVERVLSLQSRNQSTAAMGSSGGGEGATRTIA